MKISGSSLLSLLSIFYLISWVSSASTHVDFLQCLQSQNAEIIYTPSNTTYDSILESGLWNLRIASEPTLKPTLIITPLNETHIQAAIYCSRKHGFQIRTRSGGHDYEGLSYLSEVPFIVIDLRNFRSISIDHENKTAWVESGAIVGELYYRIAEISRTLAVTGAVCPSIGVGGYFSGGGFGMLARKFGLGADNILDAKIIDVNGRVLDKNSMGEDLFWAIRGGGGASFGVILSWQVKLYTVPEYVTVFNVSRTLEQNATQLVHTWQDIADKIDENLMIRLFIRNKNSGQGNKKTINVAFTSMFLGGINELLPLMQKSFPELGMVEEDCIEMSWIESVMYFSYLTDQPLDALLSRTPLSKLSRQYFKGKSDFVSQPISENGLNGIWEWLLEQDAVELQLSPYGGRLNDFSDSDLPFPHRPGNIYQIEHAVAWNEEQNSEASEYLRWIRRFYKYMARYVSKSPRAAYVNYRDLDLGVNNIGYTSYAQASIWGKRYFKDNFKRLVHVKTKVDPDNFFKNEQSIPDNFFKNEQSIPDNFFKNEQSIPDNFFKNEQSISFLAPQ